MLSHTLSHFTPKASDNFYIREKANPPRIEHDKVTKRGSEVGAHNSQEACTLVFGYFLEQPVFSFKNSSHPMPALVLLSLTPKTWTNHSFPLFFFLYCGIISWIPHLFLHTQITLHKTHLLNSLSSNNLMIDQWLLQGIHFTLHIHHFPCSTLSPTFHDYYKSISILVYYSKNTQR